MELTEIEKQVITSAIWESIDQNINLITRYGEKYRKEANRAIQRRLMILGKINNQEDNKGNVSKEN